MMKRFMVYGLWFMGLILLTGPVYAQTPTPTCNPSVPGDCPAGLQQIEDLFKQIISVIAGLGFIALLALLVWTGFKYLMSGGEQKAVHAAHQTATWALLGIVSMAIAWLVLQLIQAFTGIDDVTFFNIRALCGDPTDKTNVAKWFCGNP